jgi:hypothetical protein
VGRRSKAIVVCSVIGVAIATSVYAEQKGGAGRGTNGDDIHQPSTDTTGLTIPLGVQTSIKDIASALKTANAREGSHQKAKDASDYLQSQENMAAWAGRMFGIGLGELLVTFLGVVLVAFTLRATRRAASAAEGTLTEIKGNARKELRAYLSVEADGINTFITSGEKRCIGHVKIRNVGKIPAKNVFASVDITLNNTRDFSPSPIPDNPAIERSIQPDAFMRQGSKHQPPVSEVQRSERFSFVWGTVWYDDGYGERRYTRFCHRYHGASHSPDEYQDIGGLQTLVTPYTIIKADKARYHEHGNDST